MANRRDDKEKTHEKLLSSMKQDNISEEEADELREEGRGFERRSADSGDEVERLAQGQPPSTDARSYRTPSEQPADEDAPGRRGGRRGFSETEQTQTEEDFGERGLNMRGGKHDSENKPSILEPEPE